ncbi:SigE family RNA polymerase sigma factor [Knoellia koreensis]|uniref:SigE family RNA polymerase sigma factor n=1 Tax=Knoellia koreensis TaxID=2730921 RepID=A0A849HGW1_9MICO|nr:SigE family RNA polymerase sigma factor [Knoellia sp. DB2414S]
MSSDDDFVDFVRGASPRLLKTAWFISGDPVQAEELVQAALERVFVRWRRVSSGDPLAYTRKVLLNLHIDDRRRASREAPSHDVPDRGVTDRGPEDADHVVRLLAALPLRERQVVVMRHYAGLPEADVADLLGISLGTVKSSASRGLAKLRESLAREENSHAH